MVRHQKLGDALICMKHTITGKREEMFKITQSRSANVLKFSRWKHLHEILVPDFITELFC